MERDEHHRQRAQELRAIAYFIDDQKKQATLLWLAHDHEAMAGPEESAGSTLLVHRLHMVRIAEQLRPLAV